MNCVRYSQSTVETAALSRAEQRRHRLRERDAAQRRRLDAAAVAVGAAEEVAAHADAPRAVEQVRGGQRALARRLRVVPRTLTTTTTTAT